MPLAQGGGYEPYVPERGHGHQTVQLNEDIFSTQYAVRSTAITVATVILWALDRVRGRALVVPLLEA